MTSEYKCKHCGHPKARHQAKSYHCPKITKYNRNFPQWLTTTYEPDYDKPLPKPKFVI